MRFNEFTGHLMSRDVELAKIENGVITNVLKPELMPIYLKLTQNFEHWLEQRAIDSHRPHSRLIKKALRLKEKDDVSVVLSVNAVTLTDNYWVKDEGSDLTWKDVQFDKDTFAKLALKGDMSAFELEPERSPELTNTGSFEKSWELHDGKWWMHKKGNKDEIFSEMFVYLLGKELGFSMAIYEPDDDCIKSLDFTNGAAVNYETAYSWIGENEDYVDNYKYLENISSKLADQYVELLLMDSFCRNGDRHTGNYGILRDVNTGDILSLAPNYDNNQSLICSGVKNKDRQPDLFGTFLHELEDETHAIKKYLSRNKMPVITDKMIDKCIDAIGMDVNRDYIKKFVQVGYEQTPLEEYREMERIQNKERQADTR